MLTRKQIETWLTWRKIVNFEITDDLVVNVNDNVDLYDRGSTSIPFRFGVVTGNFRCHNNELSSLLHAPRFVGKDFLCNGNKLTSLKHAPVYVGGNFTCHNNKLTSLEHAPRFVGESFYCFSNSKRFELSDLPKETILNRKFIC